MPKTDSSLMMLAVAALVALGVGYYVPRTFSSSRAQVEASQTQTPAKSGEPASAAGTAAKPAPRTAGAWVASGPGRVEPATGEVRVGAQAAGRVAEVLVAVNDKVQTGDLMMRLDDEDQQARILALSAEVAVRKRERDATEVAAGNLARDRRIAEDNLSNGERSLYLVREDLDRALRSRASAEEIDKARDAVTKARERVEQSRTALRKALGVDGLAAPSRSEVALTAARAELSSAEAALERTRVRAPLNGTVLAFNARVGEVMAPSPELPVAVVGGLSQLRVRAEFEERDLGKVRDGQIAVVRSDAFQGRDFEGKVASVSPSLSASKIGQRGPRKMNDVDVLEVLINLTGQPPLLPGMRVDVFLKLDAQASADRPAKAN